MPKRAKHRDIEQRYLGKTRDRLSRIPKKARSKTPWKEFFMQGVGTTLVTSVGRASIHSIAHTYGKAMGLKFKCEIEATEDGESRVTLVSIQERRD